MGRALASAPLVALLAVAAAAAPARAVERGEVWSVGLSAAFGVISPDDVNRRIGFDNLDFATAVGPIESYREVAGDLRYGIAPRVSLEGRFGFLWREHDDGFVSRRVSAKQLTGYVLYHPFAPGTRTVALLAGGGILLGAKISGEDPLNGFEGSGSGPVIEAGVELEQALSRTWTVRGRAVGRHARARDVLRDGTDLDLSGGAFQIGLRVYFP